MAADAANVAHIRHAGMRRELGEAGGVHLFDGGNALKNRLGVENVKIGVAAAQAIGLAVYECP